MTCDTCIASLDLLKYIQGAHRPVTTEELVSISGATQQQINTKCLKLTRQGYLEHPTGTTWVAVGTTPNCVLCHGPITPWFYITLKNGGKVCEGCIFANMEAPQ